jgi:hypothetical protein
MEEKNHHVTGCLQFYLTGKNRIEGQGKNAPADYHRKLHPRTVFNGFR